MDGILSGKGLMLVGIDKKEIGDGSYYYNLAFSNGKEILSLTAGKKADECQIFQKYNLGLNYVGGKLKLADIEQIK